MKQPVAQTEFLAWEARQPRRFDLLDGLPVARPNEQQGASRLERARAIAARVLLREEDAIPWLDTPQAALGGLKPTSLAADSEEGCRKVLMLLVSLRRRGDSG